MLLHQLQRLVAHRFGPFVLQHAHPHRIVVGLHEVQSRHVVNAHPRQHRSDEVPVAHLIRNIKGIATGLREMERSHNVRLSSNMRRNCDEYVKNIYVVNKAKICVRTLVRGKAMR